MPNSASYYQQLLSNPNVQSFLNLIGYAEGADYNTGYGNRPITNYAQHPYRVGQFRITDPVTHRPSTTSAAGKYQYERRTWDSVAGALGLSDFSPQNQDIAALKLIDDKHQLDNVINGNVGTAIDALKSTWQGFVTNHISTLLAHYSGEKKKNQTPLAPCQQEP